MHMGTSSTSYFFPKFFFRVLIVVGLVCLLVVGGERIEQTSELSTKGLKHEQVIGRENKHVSYKELDFNYMSKRRVPNGSDPIHNRRARNSGRSSGKA